MLIDRVDERATLNALLEQVRAGMSGALVLWGEAGIGKSALLAGTAESAEEFSVIRLQGIESEMQLGYAALHRLLRPYLGRAERLPRPQHDALLSAFGLASIAPADRFLVSLAALSLLGDIAKENPLLVTVDDAQWLDRESVAALVFIARRLHADRIGLVFAARESPDMFGTFQGIPEHKLSGLADDYSRHLLTVSIATPVSHRVVERILAVTHGNPLAILELSGELTSEHLVDHAPLPDPLPISDLIEARFVRQVRKLPVDTQLMLLVAAAEPEGDPRTIRLAGVELGLAPDAIEPAVDEALLHIGTRVDFRHPLVRSAVYSGATTQHRRLVHHALANVTDIDRDPDRRALHLALGALGPDEEVAAALERSAANAGARGGYIAESSFLVRAAGLTPDIQRKAGRLLRAAEAALLAGNPTYSEALLQQARPDLVTPIELAQAKRLDGDLRYHLGDVHRGPFLLVEAARAFQPLDRVLSHYALLEAFADCAVTQQFSERTTGIEIALTALASLKDQSTPPSAAETLLKGVALRFAAPYVDAVPAMREAVRAQDEMTPEEICRWTYLSSLVAVELWDEVGLRDTLDRLDQTSRAHGALASLQVALIGMAVNDRRAGNFMAARQRYSELREVTIAVNGFLEIYDLQDLDLIVWQEGTPARSRAAELIEAAKAFRVASLIHNANLALSYLDLAEGRYEEALAAARSVTEGDAIGWGCQALPNLIEAGVRCGEGEAAVIALRLLAERAAASATPWALGILARSSALVEGDDRAAAHYEKALEHFGKTSWLTEVARTHLLYGEWLRRQKRRLDAREHLRRAYEMFDLMGARPFAERARVELMATGERARPRRAETAHVLTSRELQIARLAAQRATSSEIASQLFISSHTVDYHLRKVFQKLGITSRRQLAESLPREVGQLV